MNFFSSTQLKVEAYTHSEVFVQVHSPRQKGEMQLWIQLMNNALLGPASLPPLGQCPTLLSEPYFMYLILPLVSLLIIASSVPPRREELASPTQTVFRSLL